MLWGLTDSQKQVFVTKWVGKARNREILIPIDAARSGDLENRGFGKNIKDNLWKIDVFLFGVLRWGRGNGNPPRVTEVSLTRIN